MRNPPPICWNINQQALRIMKEKVRDFKKIKIKKKNYPEQLHLNLFDFFKTISSNAFELLLMWLSSLTHNSEAKPLQQT